MRLFCVRDEGILTSSMCPFPGRLLDKNRSKTLVFPRPNPTGAHFLRCYCCDLSDFFRIHVRHIPTSLWCANLLCVCVCVMIIDLHSKWFGQKSDVVFDSSSKALAIRQVSRGQETYVLLQFYPFGGNESGKTRKLKKNKKIKKSHELHLYVRYVGVVRFVFHVLQLLLMRFTQRKVWRINKSMMKHQQESDQNSGMPLMFWLWLLKGRVCWWLNNT
jgi:hypothetical protein